jgi:outer membrane lipoprotein-sorting protein
MAVCNRTTKQVFCFACLIFLCLPSLSCVVKKPAVQPDSVSYANFPASFFDPLDKEDVLTALAEITVITRHVSYPAKVALMMKRPSYIRMERIPIIGVSDFLLTATPDTMNIFIPSQGVLYRGKPTRDNLKKFLPWSIPVEDMVMIFTGTCPFGQDRVVRCQNFQDGTDRCGEMKAPSGQFQTICINDRNQLSRFVRKDLTGDELYRVKYVYTEDAGHFPQQIIIQMGDGSTSLSIKYSDVSIDQSADLSAFNLVVPDHVQIMTLE